MWSTCARIIDTRDGKRINKWKRAIILGHGDDYDFLTSVVCDAKQKESMDYYSKYYQCAKFIRYYHMLNYKFKKTAITYKTCCKAYPEDCGGKCCGRSIECQCDIIPDTYNKIDNCYNDCCAIYRYKSRREFTISWL
jgi:hypothetical protein